MLIAKPIVRSVFVGRMITKLAQLRAPAHSECAFGHGLSARDQRLSAGLGPRANAYRGFGVRLSAFGCRRSAFGIRLD